MMGEYLNYDTFADLYDRTRVMPSDVITEVANICGRAAKLQRGGMFLDAGVGTGRFGAPLAKAFPGRIVGVDVSTEMLARAREKSKSLLLVRGDLQRLPFPSRTFDGVLMVHILHLIQHWEGVVDELRRVIIPGGILILGGEQGGRSALVDFYFQQARGRDISTDSLGAPGMTQPISYLRRRRPNGSMAHVELLSSPRMVWRRRVPARETLDVLDARAYSQMRHVGDDAHRELMETTSAYARSTFGSLDAVEDLETRFVLYGARV